MLPETSTPLYAFTSEQILNQFSSDLKGLSEEESRKRLQEFGPNIIEKQQNWQWLKLAAGQFNNTFVWILGVAAALAFLFQEYRDSTILLIIIFTNAVIGFFQEFKAERIIQQINKLTTDKALVFRDGEKKEMESRDLVPGDIVYLAAGDNVPADGYLIETYDLYVNDFIFTGESRPHKKQAGALVEANLTLAEMDNMVFTGSMVTRGEGLLAVSATGTRTELGRIAHMTTEVEDEETPLQKRIKILGRDVTVLAVLVGLVVLIIGKYYGVSWYNNFLFALAVAVSVVPEGLPAALSVALSLGMKRLLKEKVLVKKLASVETLGSVSVICTDKTGTITKNELMVTKIVQGEKAFEVDGDGYNPQGNFYFDNKKIDLSGLSGLEMLFKIGALCNDAELTKKDGQYEVVGDPTEGAIVVAAKKYHSDPAYFHAGETKVGEFPFSSTRMRMSVVYKNADENIYSYVKGSPDAMLELSTHILEEGKVKVLSESKKEKLRSIYNEMSEQALRVLALAYRDLDHIPQSRHINEAERKLVWVGMMAMIDPPRKDVAAAIRQCQESGIKVLMITGDYEITARAIAKNVGLIDNDPDSPDDSVISGKIIDGLTDEDIGARIKNGNVIFARITPEQKLRLAAILKADGSVIAMTGDGVNDALALKKADIGVAMGKIGTDVAKEAGDMILLDDNFSSIVSGIREGRTIYANIRKIVHYVFTSNASEFFTVVLGSVLGLPSPITAIQILAIDLGTDVLPSLALGVEPIESNIMDKKPVDSKQKVIDIHGFRRLLNLGILMAVGAVIAFVWSMKRGGWDFGDPFNPDSLLYIKSTTAVYAVLAMSQMANLLVSRSETSSVFKIGIFKNWMVIGSMIFSVSLFWLFMYVPFLASYLHMRPIDFQDWLVVIMTTLVVFGFEEMRKKY